MVIGISQRCYNLAACGRHSPKTDYLLKMCDNSVVVEDISLLL